jgi:hypothetical protein
MQTMLTVLTLRRRLQVERSDTTSAARSSGAKEQEAWNEHQL